MPDRPPPGPDLEELLLDTLDCVSRAKAGRLQALEGAIHELNRKRRRIGRRRSWNDQSKVRKQHYRQS